MRVTVVARLAVWVSAAHRDVPIFELIHGTATDARERRGAGDETVHGDAGDARDACGYLATTSACVLSCEAKCGGTGAPLLEG